MFIPWPSVFPMSSGLADVAVMVPLNAVVAAVVVCWRTGIGCRVGSVGVLRVVYCFLGPCCRTLNTDVRWVSAASRMKAVGVSYEPRAC